MQSMHQPYFPNANPSPYAPSFANSQYSPLMPPQGPGIAIANPGMSSAPTSPGTKQGAVGQKRKQVKNACVNCQKACKKCDEGRPCSRCVKYGLTDTCQDSTRKERKKGIKRGPYKRRQPTSQSGSASASPSNVPLGNPLGNPPTSYTPLSASPSMRQNPFPYSHQGMNQFSQGYETLNHYGYATAYSKEYMMPPIFSGNQVLYSPLVQTQQQEILSRSVSQSPPLTAYIPPKTNSPMLHHSQTHTPASSNSTAGSPNPNDNEVEESSKLAMLSQLCSNVLDSNDTPKTEEGEPASSSPLDHQRDTHSQPSQHTQVSGLKKRHGGLPNHQTPPPSPPHHAHSRTPSYEHPQHNPSQVFHPGHSPHTHSQNSSYNMNSHLGSSHRHMIYETPGNSPSPVEPSFPMALPDESPKNSNIAVSVSQSHSGQQSAAGSPFWPVQSDHYPYGNGHYQSNGNGHGQSQAGQDGWGIHVW